MRRASRKSLSPTQGEYVSTSRQQLIEAFCHQLPHIHQGHASKGERQSWLTLFATQPKPNAESKQFLLVASTQDDRPELEVMCLVTPHGLDAVQSVEHAKVFRPGHMVDTAEPKTLLHDVLNEADFPHGRVKLMPLRLPSPRLKIYQHIPLGAFTIYRTEYAGPALSSAIPS